MRKAEDLLASAWADFEAKIEEILPELVRESISEDLVEALSGERWSYDDTRNDALVAKAFDVLATALGGVDNLAYTMLYFLPEAIKRGIVKPEVQLRQRPPEVDDDFYCVAEGTECRMTFTAGQGDGDLVLHAIPASVEAGVEAEKPTNASH